MSQDMATPESQQVTVTLFTDALRLRLAESANTTTDLLAELSQDPSREVRLAVAENSITPHFILELLALDEDPDVRYGMAANAQIPAAILILLAQDENPFISNRALSTMAALASQRQLLRFPIQPQRPQSAQRTS